MPPVDIDTRLAALEARAPGGEPPELKGSRRSVRFATPLAIASVLVLGMVASAAAGGAVVATLVQATEGVQNPGQPLEGAKLECKSPPEARAFLAERGFTDVVWQVESGVAGAKVEPIRPAGRAARARLRDPRRDPQRREAVHDRGPARGCHRQRGLPRPPDALTWSRPGASCAPPRPRRPRAGVHPPAATATPTPSRPRHGLTTHRWCGG